MPSVAVMIVARNAAPTIGGAIESALAEPIDELLVVDDCSSDDTVGIANAFLDTRVRVACLDRHLTLGYARSVGLSRIRSDICFTLDADDALLLGRTSRLVHALEREGADFVADEIRLVDGLTGACLRDLKIPAFLDEPPGLLRLFERNYLPGIGQIGFRVQRMREVGYDSNIHGTEDSDLVCRALLKGLKPVLVREIGYEMRHFPSSVSRNRVKQSENLAKALRKHRLDVLRRRLEVTGARREIIDWILFSLALFQGDWVGAEHLLDRISRFSNPEEVLEPNGPVPLVEKWRLDFARGTLTLLQDGDKATALTYLERAVETSPRADALNNLGVAYTRIGEATKARSCFSRALGIFPGYADASGNLKCVESADLVTIHPLRREASRSEY